MKRNIDWLIAFSGWQGLRRVLRVLWQAFGEYKVLLFLLVFLSFVSGILEGIGINAIIPLFSFIDPNQAPGNDILSQGIARFFTLLHIGYTIRSLLIFIILLFVVKAFVLFWTTYIGARITYDYEKETRTKLLRASLYADWPYVSKQKLGYLDQILTNDLTRGSNLFLYVSALILVVVNTIVYSLLVVNVSIAIALSTLVLGIGGIWAFRALFRRGRMLSEKVAAIFKDVAHYINQNVLGMKTVKAMIAERSVLGRANLYFERLRLFHMKMTALQNLSNVIIQPIGLLFIILIFAFFYKVTAFNFGAFAVVVYAINKVFSNIQLAQSQAHRISMLLPYLENVLQYGIDVKQHQEAIDSGKIIHLQKDIRFDHVSFSYSETPVLQDVSFVIHKGMFVGLIGPSGVGKTTLVDLLMRFFPPKSGKVSVDGIDLKDIDLRHWRERMGYVSQDVFLMNDTVENNIRFYNENLSSEELIAAAKSANIYDFILGLPNQFQTVVGERGMLLSGGQRQRIALARVLARKPEILILDEATSSLDNESEVLIQKSIEELRGKITIIVIAHRLSTIKIADNLLVLENGKIIEEGKPEELLKNKDSYFFRVNNLNA